MGIEIAYGPPVRAVNCVSCVQDTRRKETVVKGEVPLKDSGSYGIVRMSLVE